MKEALIFFLNITLAAVDLIVAYYICFGIRFLLQKNRLWIRYFLIGIGVLLFQTALFSWLPGRVELEYSLFEGTLVFEDGALFHNLGFLLLAYSMGIGIMVLKYLWQVIRKKESFSGKLFLLEVVFCAVGCVLSVPLINNTYVIHFEGGEAAGTIVLLILAVVGAILVIWGFKTTRSEKKQKESERLQKEQSAAPQQPQTESLSPFDQLVAEKNRLTKQGDYASQIPLLIEATGLDVDDLRKAIIWNYLGIAYRETNSANKSSECFQTALQLDKNNPSAYNNLALYYAEKKDFVLAETYMNTAVAKAKDRRIDLHVFYENYALIAGQSGDMQKARGYLRLAEEAGSDSNTFSALKKRFEIN